MFFDQLSDLHENLEFTVEVAGCNLSFLDVNAKLIDNNFETRVYRKSTNTNILLNFDAIVLVAWKSGLIMYMLKRAWSICYSINIFKNEVDILRSFFF